MESSNYYVYLHRLSDTGEVFYVGKGHGRRAWDKVDRNVYWKAKTHGRCYEIVFYAENLTEDQAFTVEKQLIADYKNIFNGGTLVNLTEGGEGRTGFSWEGQRQGRQNPMFGRSQSLQARKKIADSKKGKPRPMHVVEASRNYNKNRPKEKHGMYGKKHTLEAREKMKTAAKTRVYKTTDILNIETGIFYKGWAEVAQVLNATIHRIEYLRRNNKLTNLKAL